MSALLAAVVLLPLCGTVLCVVLPGRWGSRVTGGVAAGTAGAVGLVVVRVHSGGEQRVAVAGWDPPLGIRLVADGLSAAFLAMTAVVVVALTAYASGTSRARGGPMFWPLLLALWCALNAVYLAGDLFNAYVALELMTLAAVGLVALAGGAALRAALRYLVVAVLGSLLYLLGVALLYGELATLDMAALGRAAERTPATTTALAAMTVGMALKSALFPLHGWLPPAHAGAPAAVSPALSGLVVKASLYLAVRVWSTALPDVATVPVATALGGLGALAVAWGSVAALRQDRLKLVVAYSTVAQVGYLFLIFPLALAPDAPTDAARDGWSGVLGVALAHGLAKSAMFMAAGTLALAHGSDQLALLAGAATRRPVACAAFALAGVSLAGLPPSGGFAGKWLVLQSSLGQGQWWWAALVLGGGLLTVAYVGRVMRVVYADAVPEAPGASVRPVPRRMDAVPLVMAVLAVAAGLLALEPLRLLADGSPFGAAS